MKANTLLLNIVLACALCVLVLGKCSAADDSLAAAWSKLHWSVPDRGALLLVYGAAHHLPTSEGKHHYDPFSHQYGETFEALEDSPYQRAKKSSLPPVPRGGYNLAALLPLFECELVRYPSLSTIVPNKVSVFTPPHRFPTGKSIEDHEDFEEQELRKKAKLLSLVATLTPAQWERAGTANGLPLASLQPSQQRLFQAAIGTGRINFHFTTGIAPPAWMRIAEETQDIPVLPEALQQGLCLRLQRRWANAPVPISPKEAAESRVVVLHPTPSDDGVGNGLIYPFVRNHPLPTNLLLTHLKLQRRVALPANTTVGELVRQLSAATQLPLYADARIAKRSVHTRGTSALATDLVAGLCRAVGGTIRLVTDGDKSVYLLTDDCLTMAERISRLSLQKVRYGREAAESLRALGEEARRGLLDLQKNESFSPLPQAQGGSGEEELVVEVFSPSLRATGSLTQLRRYLPQPERPRISLPANLITRAFLTRLPNDPTQIEALVTQVKSFGFTELRVALSPDEESSPVVTTLAAAARKAKLGFVPTLSVLAARTPEQPRERSVLGQTHLEWWKSPALRLAATIPSAFELRPEPPVDFVTPEAVDVPAFVAQLQRLSALPGVTSIGVWDLAAPGYRMDSLSDGIDLEGDARSELGYRALSWRPAGLLGQRVALIRSQGFDPLDFETESLQITAVEVAWNQGLVERRDVLLKRLSTEIKKKGVTLPLQAQNPTNHNWNRWVAGYPLGHEGPTAVHTISYLQCQQDSEPLDERAGSLIGEPEPLRQALRSFLAENNGPPSNGTEKSPLDMRYHWDGILLDFQTLPLEDALETVGRTLQHPNEPNPK